MTGRGLCWEERLVTIQLSEILRVDVFEAVRTVLAVRAYKDKPVPEAVLRRIVEAGQQTASSMNLQPWHFVVVEDRDTLARLAVMARTGPYIAQAPLSIIVLTERTKYTVSDASRAIQSMVLTAWDAGVGSNWVGFGPIPEVNQLLGIPHELDVLAVVPFGYPHQSPGRGKKKRKPLQDVVSRGRFGQPFQ